MSAERIPKEIELGALRRANARAKAAREVRLDPDPVAQRIRDAATAAGLEDRPAQGEEPALSKARLYIDQLVEDRSKLRPPPGTHPVSAFWSYGVEHAEAPPNRDGVPFLDQRFIAEEWAHQQNQKEPGSAQTLETSRGGRELDDMFLWEKKVLEALGGQQAGFGPDFAATCWQTISGTYAEVAEGEVFVFADTANTRSILHQRELSALCANDKVGLDNIRFVYESPVKWPEVTRTEVGTNAVRTVAQFDNPALPRYLDPYSYPADEPEVRKANIDSLLALAAPSQEAAAVAAAGVEASAVTGPGVGTPAVGSAVVEAPVVEAPADRAPAVGTPVAGTPAVETPVVKAPAAEAPAVEAAAAVREPAIQAPRKSVRTPLWQVGFDHTPTAARPSTPGQAAGAGPAVEPVLVPRPLGTGMDGPS
ncbi:hypothetical protein ACFWBC_09740 [Streptomyces sp. NPDC059985]|uniref:hypothetical protein n=1 Tax=Streptomyces sp. NPDC059985 TaxID=3347025 RepID=UPI0036C28F4F